MKEYDYLIVGAGLFGAVFAHEARCAGKRCLVIDKRGQRGGNLYCEDVEGIHVHKYGAHIFHTDNKEVWDYVNSFVEFNRYTNSPLARFGDKLYNLPFNMNTFYQLWGVDRRATPGVCPYHRACQSGRTGFETVRKRHLPLSDKRVYRETMGQGGHRITCIHHQTYPFPLCV